MGLCKFEPKEEIVARFVAAVFQHCEALAKAPDPVTLKFEMLEESRQKLNNKYKEEKRKELEEILKNPREVFALDMVDDVEINEIAKCMNDETVSEPAAGDAPLPASGGASGNRNSSSGSGSGGGPGQNEVRRVGQPQNDGNMLLDALRGGRGRRFRCIVVHPKTIRYRCNNGSESSVSRCSGDVYKVQVYEEGMDAMGYLHESGRYYGYLNVATVTNPISYAFLFKNAGHLSGLVQLVLAGNSDVTTLQPVLSQLPHLRVLELSYFTGLLTIDFSDVKRSIRIVRLSTVPKLHSLVAIEECAEMEGLALTYCDSLTSPVNCRAMLRLAYLNVYCCPKLTQMSGVGCLTRLKFLWVYNCPVLTTIGGVPGTRPPGMKIWIKYCPNLPENNTKVNL